MKERNRFEQEMRALGVRPGADGRPRLAMRPKMGGAEREFFDKTPVGPGGGSPSAPRLSNGALGEAFADLQAAAKVPDEAIKKLANSVVFKNWMVKPIDANYVDLNKLMILTGGKQPPIDDNGWVTVTIAKKVVKRRVLLVSPASAGTEFRRALTVDNLGIADIVDIAAPPPDSLQVLGWIRRILCMVAQVRNEAITKRKMPAYMPSVDSEILRNRVKARVKEQVDVRLKVNEVLKEINLPTMFTGTTGQAAIEFSYYPADVVFDGPFILTNLEYFSLFECMEEARRQKKLKTEDIEKLKAQMQRTDVPGDISGLLQKLRSLKPFFDIPSHNDLVLSGFEKFYLARILIHHRWRLFDPGHPDHQPWLSQPDVAAMRQEHAVPVFPPGLKYFVDIH